jgi:hypothetical protein
MKVWIGVAVLFAAFFWSLRAGSDEPTVDPLFQRHPYEGLVKTASGKVPVPFHGYSMDPVIIQGLVDLKYAKEILKNEDWVPVGTRDGKALASIWFMHYDNCTLRAYQEIIFAIVVAQNPLTVDVDNDLSIGTLPLTNPSTRFLSWRLWLDSQIAIDYGRELLGIDKRSMTVDAWTIKDTFREYRIQSQGKMLLNAELTMNSGTLSQLAFIPSAVSAVGFKGLSLEEMYMPVSQMKGVVKGTTNNVYLHFWVRGDPILTSWKSSSFKLEFGDELKGWQFVPKYIQWMPNERFVVELAAGVPVLIEPFDPNWESKVTWK